MRTVYPTRTLSPASVAGGSLAQDSAAETGCNNHNSVEHDSDGANNDNDNVCDDFVLKLSSSSSNCELNGRAASFDYFRNRLIDANNRL